MTVLGHETSVPPSHQLFCAGRVLFLICQHPQDNLEMKLHDWSRCHIIVTCTVAHDIILQLGSNILVLKNVLPLVRRQRCMHCDWQDGYCNASLRSRL